MKSFTYSEARQDFAQLLVLAQNEEIEIRREDGAVFSLISKCANSSPFAVSGINAKATTQNILDAFHDSRAI